MAIRVTISVYHPYERSAPVTSTHPEFKKGQDIDNSTIDAPTTLALQIIFIIFTAMNLLCHSVCSKIRNKRSKEPAGKKQIEDKGKNEGTDKSEQPKEQSKSTENSTDSASSNGLDSKK